VLLKLLPIVVVLCLCAVLILALHWMATTHKPKTFDKPPAFPVDLTPSTRAHRVREGISAFQYALIGCIVAVFVIRAIVWAVAK
jgi:hypothetical protein